MESKAATLNRTAQRRNAFYLDVSEHMTHMLIKECGVEQERAIELAEGLVKKLIQLLSGQSIYFPHDTQYELTARDEEISDRLNRGNAHELAAEYGLSFVRVYQIARAVRARRAAQSNAEMPAAKRAAKVSQSPSADQAEGSGDTAHNPSSWMYQALTKHLGKQ